MRDRRIANARGLAAFGIADPETAPCSLSRTVRSGKAETIYTIGYEKKSGDDLIRELLASGVEVLADIRERPMSRLPDFRAASLAMACTTAGIRYQGWACLGSTQTQRDELAETGDIAQFHRVFRSYAKRQMKADIVRLATVSQEKVVALLCYERRHEDCHRSVIADLVADVMGASVIAIG